MAIEMRFVGLYNPLQKKIDDNKRIKNRKRKKKAPKIIIFVYLDKLEWNRGGVVRFFFKIILFF